VNRTDAVGLQIDMSDPVAIEAGVRDLPDDLVEGLRLTYVGLCDRWPEHDALWDKVVDICEAEKARRMAAPPPPPEEPPAEGLGVKDSSSDDGGEDAR